MEYYQSCKKIKDSGSSSSNSRNQVAESKSLVHIPQEIIENILSRLPCKVLTRFECVCKTWHSFLTNPNFQSQSVLSISGSSSIRFFQTITQHGTLTEKLPVPWGDSKSTIYVSNSCNGMVLICVGICFYLFNPSTHYFTKVLTLDYMRDNNDERSYNMLIGLYYDGANNDYKAVVLVHYGLFYTSAASILVEASLKEKRWNHIYNNMKSHHTITAGPLVNGRLHWLDHGEIIRFDPVLKVFKELPFFRPPPSHTKGCRIVNIEILEGCLCVSRVDDMNNVEILSMKKYGASESWTPIFSSADQSLGYLYSCIPLLLTRTGELLISMRKSSRDNLGTICDDIRVYKYGKKSFKKCIMPSKGILRCSVPFVRNLDTPTGYYWNLTEHQKFGNTEDFERVQQFWKEIALVRSLIVRLAYNFIE